MLLYSDFSLTELNTFNLEAKAELYAEISDKSDIESFVRKRKYLEMPRIVLGNGSNIVFSSKSFKGVVLKNSIKGIEVLEENEEQIVVKVASGEDFDSFVEYCVKKRFNGLENLSGIPGSIGGSVVQNIGAYGVEIKDYVQEVEYYDFTDFCFKKINAADCKFAYRDSVFKSVMKDTFITAVTLRLYKKFQPVLGYGNLMERISGINVLTPMILRKVILGIRFEKIPDYKQYGSAGSFFKNPEITKSASEKL
ncbi:MAG: UDP-N-acetylmuramate dehydrogenase, partial [Bacteroidales bacterium]|nr:UDP-N-acetylmuramate dehydrogenase [Bacteroidales bacterium]